MIEIFLLAGAISVELEPYAVENHESDRHSQEINAEAVGRPFQWTSRRAKSGNSLNQQGHETDSFGDGVKRDAFGRPIEPENKN